jgi:MipA family protein
MSRAFRLTCFALTLFAGAAGAAEPDSPPEGGPPEDSRSYSWGLGVGALTQQQSYAGIDRENLAIPVIYFENRWIQLLGPRLDFKLPSLEWGKENELSYGVGIQLVGFGGYEPEDAPILNGMAERKEGMFGGPYVKWSNPLLDVSAEWFHDASSESEGQRMSIGLERTFHVGERFMVTPGLSAVWMDEKFVDYYYGVRANEARVDRPAYVGDSTLNTEISLRTDYMIDEKQMVFGMVEYTLLGSEIKDSPLTDRSNETMLFMGYLYRF